MPERTVARGLAQAVARLKHPGVRALERDVRECGMLWGVEGVSTE